MIEVGFCLGDRSMDEQAFIVARLEERYKVRYVPVIVDEPVGEVGFSYPELDVYATIPCYNALGVTVMRTATSLITLGDGEIVVKFGAFPLVGTVDQFRDVWLYTYALHRALEADGELPA